MDKTKIIISSILVLFLLAGAVVGVILLKNKTFIRSKAGSEPEASFTLISPNQSTQPNTTLTVSLNLRSDIYPANLFVAKLTFPVDKLEVVKIDENSQTLPLWLERSFNNTTGKLSLVAGIKTPGLRSTFGQDPLLMADITFKSKLAGEAVISFDETSAIFKDTDNTSILSKKYPVTITTAGQGGSTSFTTGLGLTTTSFKVVAGAIQVSGNPAPVGTVVESYCTANTTSGRGVVEGGNVGKYRLTVYGKDQNTKGSDQFCNQDQKINFKINGTEAKVSVKTDTDLFKGGLDSLAVIDLSI